MKCPEFTLTVGCNGSGGSFEGVKLGIEIANSAANTEVPEGLPGRTVTVDEVETVRTWLDYVDNFLNMERYNEGTKTILKAGKSGSRLMNSEELTIIHNLSYANVIEWSEFQTRVQALSDE